MTSCPTFTPIEEADPVIERSALPLGAARTEARTEVNAMRKRRTTASFAQAMARGRKRGMADPPFLVVSPAERRHHERSRAGTFSR